MLASVPAPSTHIEVFLKTEFFFSPFKPCVHTSTAFSCIRNAAFRKRFPEWSFFKKSVLIVIVWTDENEGFGLRWRHTSYSACPVRDAIVFPSSASVFEWRGGNDSNTLRVDTNFFFENRDKSRFSKISWYVWTRPLCSSVGLFRVPKTLSFKTRLSAKVFLWKWVLFVRQ